VPEGWQSSIKTTVVLPQDFTCEHCLLSWRWDSLHTPEIYTNCADIRIGSGPWDPPGGTNPPTATPPPSATAPPTATPPPPTTPPPTVEVPCLNDWTVCEEGGQPCCGSSLCFGNSAFRQCTPNV
jgi:hypothetical protein